MDLFVTRVHEQRSILGIEHGFRNPSLIFGGALVAYGLFSSRSGQLEKVSTSAGTGMLSAYVYTYVKEMA